MVSYHVHKEEDGIRIECLLNQESVGNCDISIINKTAFIELFAFDTIQQQEQLAMFLMGYTLHVLKSEVEIVKSFPNFSLVHEQKKNHLIELYTQFGFQKQNETYVLRLI